MRVFEIQEKFGLDSLKMTERPQPVAKPGQAVVKVKAASLNYRDLLTLKGMYNPRQPLPLIPCSDGAGEVVSVGEGVTRVKVGDRVMGAFAQKWLSGKNTRDKVAGSTLGGPHDGMLCEFRALDEEGLLLTPKNLTDEEASTLPCAGLTAWSALARQNTIRPGDTVLTLGTGGVSIFALQFAKMMGAKVIVTSSSDEKLERAKKLGADAGINYKTNPQWSKAVRELTGGEGVDHVIEVGGVGTLEQSIKSVRMGGNIFLIGVLAGYESPLNLTPVLMTEIRIQGIMCGHREAYEDMNEAIELAGMKPVVDKVFEFNDAPAAFREMDSGGHFGKIVVRI